jgi:hypothetical protein
LDIEFSKEGASCQSVDNLRDEWGDISVSNGPFVEGSIILYRVEFAILLFDKEEVSCIGTLRFADSAALQMLFDELMTLHDFFLGEWKESSRERGGSPQKEFDGMVPDGVSWQSL